MWSNWSGLKKLIWLYMLKGAAAVVKTVTGSAPLVLENAIASAIVSLKQYGKCVQDGTPTPDAPVDIVCNNGALGMVDDELPAGYRRILGFSMNNNSYWEIPDFPLNGSDTLRFSFEAADACNVIGAYSGSASGNNYSMYVGASSNYLRYKSGAYNSNVDFDTRYDVEITPTGSSGMKVDSAWTAQTFTTPTNFCIGTTSVTASSAKLKGKLYGTIEVVGRAELVPCERVSDNVLGYYDIVGGAFYEQASGYSGAVSLGYDGSHYTLGVVGTDEVLMVGGKNLNGGTIEHKGYAATGGESTSTTFAGTLWKIPCSAGQKFTVSWGGFPDGLTGVFISTWLTDGTWNSRQAISASTSLTYTIGAGVGEVNFTLYKTGGITIGDNAWIQVEYGETATGYQPYITPQTVTNLPSILSVGNFRDELDIISGIKTGKIGIKVLDGTEVFGKSSAYGAAFYIQSAASAWGAKKEEVLCTHFLGRPRTDSAQPDNSCFFNASGHFYFRVLDNSDAAAFKADLVAKYAAGTPVIVLYPLVEETAEQTTPHSLHTAAGTNVVSVASNVDPVDLEASYKASA